MGWFIVERVMPGEETKVIAGFADRPMADLFAQQLNTVSGAGNEYSVTERGRWDDCPCCGHEPGNGRDR